MVVKEAVVAGVVADVLEFDDGAARRVLGEQVVGDVHPGHRLAVGVLLLNAVGHEVDAHGGLDQRVEGEGVAEGLLEGRPVAQRYDVGMRQHYPGAGAAARPPLGGHVTHPYPENLARARA